MNAGVGSGLVFSKPSKKRGGPDFDLLGGAACDSARVKAPATAKRPKQTHRRRIAPLEHGGEGAWGDGTGIDSCAGGAEGAEIQRGYRRAGVEEPVRSEKRFIVAVDSLVDASRVL